ncbi:hypothetical protein WUBG_04834, partial [Wuchereria bancrofti]
MARADKGRNDNTAAYGLHPSHHRSSHHLCVRLLNAICNTDVPGLYQWWLIN